MQVLITRPQPEADRLASILNAHGIRSLVSPMLEIRPLDTPIPDPNAYQAIFVTSARALQLFANTTANRDLMVYTVGNSSARAAINLGFETVVNANGNVAALVSKIKTQLNPNGGPLLHPAGSHIAGDPSTTLSAAGFELTTVPLYEAAETQSLSRQAGAAIQDETLDAVLFFSQRTAENFVRLIKNAGLTEKCRNLQALCQSQTIAHAAKELPWKLVHVASHPDQRSLIELLKDMRKMSPESPTNQSSSIRKSGSATNHKEPTTNNGHATPADTKVIVPRNNPLTLMLSFFGFAISVGLCIWLFVWPNVVPNLLEQNESNEIHMLESRVFTLEEETRQANEPQTAPKFLAIEAILAEFRNAIGKNEQELDRLADQVGILDDKVNASNSKQIQILQRIETIATRLGAVELSSDTSKTVQNDSGKYRTTSENSGTKTPSDPQTHTKAGSNFDAEIASLESMVSKLGNQVESVSTAATNQDHVQTSILERLSLIEATMDSESRAVSHLLAVNLLREVLNTDASYHDELSAIETTAPDTTPKNVLDTLFKYSHLGVPTIASLQHRFSKIAMSIVAANSQREDGWVDSTLSRLSSVVRIRRLDNVLGKTPDAIVARAEKFVSSGDLNSATIELSQLDNAAAQTVETWLIDARARIAIDEAMESLLAQALGRDNPEP